MIYGASTRPVAQGFQDPAQKNGTIINSAHMAFRDSNQMVLSIEGVAVIGNGYRVCLPQKRPRGTRHVARSSPRVHAIQQMNWKFFTCDEIIMGDGREKQLAIKGARTASAALAKPSPADGGKAEANSGLLGIRWSKPLMRAVSTHVLCGLMTMGLPNPTTSQMATRFRSGLFEGRSPVGCEGGAHAASGRPFSEKGGLIREASRQSWGDTVTQLKEWLIFDPNDLAEAKWGLMENVLSDAQRRQLALKLGVAATAKVPMASDMRRRELVRTQMNPRSWSCLPQNLGWQLRLKCRWPLTCGGGRWS